MVKYVVSTLIFLVLLAAGGSTAQAGNPAPRGTCLAVAQGVTKLKGITCRGARKVLRAYRRSNLARRPECRGQGSIRWRGWKVTGVGRVGIATRFTRPGRSFLVSGGGTC